MDELYISVHKRLYVIMFPELFCLSTCRLNLLRFETLEKSKTSFTSQSCICVYIRTYEHTSVCTQSNRKHNIYRLDESYTINLIYYVIWMHVRGVGSLSEKSSIWLYEFIQVHTCIGLSVDIFKGFFIIICLQIN